MEQLLNQKILDPQHMMLQQILDPDSEANVIDEKLIMDELRKALGPRETIPRDLQQITHVVISFRAIRKIDNLLPLVQLTKLKLDNNTITKIENIDHLVNLQELDLSFNQITVIEGLDRLVNLTELYLFSNKITRIDGIRALTKLNIFSIGDNEIATVENLNLHLLSIFKNLQSITLVGNPVVDTMNHYVGQLLAFMPALVYIDYRPVRSMIKDGISDACVVGLDTFIAELLHPSNDPEQAKLQMVPLVADVLRDYQKKCSDTVADIKGYLENVYTGRLKEDSDFGTTLDQVQEENCNASMFGGHRLGPCCGGSNPLGDAVYVWGPYRLSIARVEAFEKTIKRAEVAMATGRLTPEDTQQLRELEAANEALYKELMNLELHQVEQVEAVQQVYVTRLRETINRLAEEEGRNFELMVNVAQEEMQKAAEPDNKEIGEALKAFLADKGAVIQSLKNSNEFRKNRYNEKEDQIVKAFEVKTQAREKEVVQAEAERNRARIHEIWTLYDTNRKRIEMLSHEAE
ncbi:putative outer arm dynein light chain 1 [Paratrimastix pyriformis]|uniref:Dynein regulatory complex subunit 3 n=1 Tax=Paratrimastix pyriformis TaxID=342808 RepID=A0ABQ8UGE3_9EUKA|nr:putative outer arm dynein light chain 1 [Paratrimastix pyriformis]